MMRPENPQPLGGIIHTYQKYDPAQFPSPNQPPPDLLSGAFEHLLAYGDLRELTDEELARAVRLDPSQIAGLGPSLEQLRQMLLERKRKILETYETRRVQQDAQREYRQLGDRLHPPKKLKDAYEEAFHQEQIRDLEQLWYRAGGERSEFARDLVQLVDRLGNKYVIDELARRWEFTGSKRLSIPEALETREELDTIERLLKQLDEAAKNARIAVIDMDALSQFADSEQIEKLEEMQRQVEQLMRQMAEQQGLERGKRGYQLTPKAFRLFQSRLLEHIFSELQSSRTGRHAGPIIGEGAVELPTTKPYEFGDSVAQMDVPSTFVNALVREGPGLPVRIRMDDIQIHRTRNTPKCATAVLMDMSGSMRYGGLYVDVKRMALALDGLIRTQFPGDHVSFIEMSTFGKRRAPAEIAALLPKPVTIFDPVVRRRYDMSHTNASETLIPPHFTNIQHSLQLARRILSAQDTPNRQLILITDGLPTAHFEEEQLYLLYPPHPATEKATLREGQLCAREGITINIFLLSSWSQSSEDIQFAYKLAEQTKGRVFFTAGRDLDRYVVWDYVNHRRTIIG